MNPYDAPKMSSDVSTDTENATASRRFRWFVIPAALSWCFGGLFLLAVPFGIYHMLPIDVEASWDELALRYASIAMIPVMTISGCLNIMSGNRWLRGRWIAALFLNICAYGILTIPPIIEDVAANQPRLTSTSLDISEKIAEVLDARETSEQLVLNSNFTLRSA